MKRKAARIGLGVVLGLVVVLAAARIAAPYVLNHVINTKLSEMPKYYGHVDDVDISVIQAQYEMQNLALFKRQAEHRIPYFAVKDIVIGLQWGALLEGKLVADAKVTDPVINVVLAKTERSTQVEPPPNFKEQLAQMVPLELNHLEVVNGKVTFKDIRKKPPVNVVLEQVYVIVDDIRTRPGDKPDEHPTKGALTAKLEDTSELKITGSANMFDDPHPAVDMNISLRSFPLVKLNDFAKAYAKVDFKSGRFSFFGEVAAKNRRVTGYVKPIFRNVEILGGEEDAHDNVVELAWEAFVSAVSKLFENHKKDQIATKIPIEGTIDAANPSVSAAVLSLLGNAFLKALFPGVDNTVSLRSIGGGETVKSHEG